MLETYRYHQDRPGTTVERSRCSCVLGSSTYPTPGRSEDRPQIRTLCLRARRWGSRPEVGRWDPQTRPVSAQAADPYARATGTGEAWRHGGQLGMAVHP